MEIAALILSTLALLISTGISVFVLSKHLSTHSIEFKPVDVDKLTKADQKLNEKLMEAEEEWL